MTPCPVCGSPDRSCGLHADTVAIVDIPAEAIPQGPATVLADAKINGVATIIRTTPEAAAAAGWTVRGPIRHQAITAPEAAVPIGLDGPPVDHAGDLDALSRRELAAAARAAGVPATGTNAQIRERLRSTR